MNDDLSDAMKRTIAHFLAGLTDEGVGYVRQCILEREGERDNQIDFLAHPYGVAFHGPVSEMMRVTVRGYALPYIGIAPASNDPEGEWGVSLDERFVIFGHDEEVRKWLAFIADCMAVAAGYPCHGRPQKKNPYAKRVTRLGPQEIDNLQTPEGEAHGRNL